MRLIFAEEIEELFYKQVEYGATDLMDAFDDALNDAQTVIPNCPTDCRWRGVRHQRCSCCVRNFMNMKDGYERKDGDTNGST